MAGIDAFGTELRRGDGATPTEVFTAIGHVTNIGGPSLSKEAYDVTTHGSPDQYREFIPGLKDGGEVSLDLNYDPAVHDPVPLGFDDTTLSNYELEFPDGSLFEFTAFLMDFEPEAPHDDKLSLSLTFKVSGKPTFTAGS